MADAQPVMYGIPNCNTIKKARIWLEQNGIEYSFHDYKKLGTTQSQLKAWLKELGWEQLINKRGTTWRNLDEEVKTSMNDDLAVSVMMENHSIIKRPLLETSGKKLLGFDEAVYQQELL